jgi:PAS domain S-box-containing protein
LKGPASPLYFGPERKPTAAVVPDALRQVGGLIDALPDGVAVVSQEGAILFANRQLELLTGYSRSELLRLKIEDLVPGHQRAPHRQHRAAFAKHPVQRPMGADLRVELLRKDLSELPVDIALSPLADGSGSVVAAVRYAGLRRAAQEAMRQLAIIGDRERVSRRLHGEVIHELFAIGLNLQALAAQIVDDGLRRRIEDAVSATDRAIDSLRKVIFESTDRLVEVESRLPDRH